VLPIIIIPQHVVKSMGSNVAYISVADFFHPL